MLVWPSAWNVTEWPYVSCKRWQGQSKACSAWPWLAPSLHVCVYTVCTVYIYIYTVCTCVCASEGCYRGAPGTHATLGPHGANPQAPCTMYQTISNYIKLYQAVADDAPSASAVLHACSAGVLWDMCCVPLFAGYLIVSRHHQLAGTILDQLLSFDAHSMETAAHSSSFLTHRDAWEAATMHVALHLHTFLWVYSARPQLNLHALACTGHSRQPHPRRVRLSAFG